MSDTAINPGVGSITIAGYTPLVVQSYTNSGTDSVSTTTLSQLFPSQRVPFLNKDGTMTNEWYRYFQFAKQYIATGAASISFDDLINTINTAAENSGRLDNLTTALQAQNVQNAASLKAVVTVTQTAALPGAASIPPVQDRPVIGGGGE